MYYNEFYDSSGLPKIKNQLLKNPDLPYQKILNIYKNGEIYDSEKHTNLENLKYHALCDTIDSNDKYSVYNIKFLIEQCGCPVYPLKFNDKDHRIPIFQILNKDQNSYPSGDQLKITKMLVQVGEGNLNISYNIQNKLITPTQYANRIYDSFIDLILQSLKFENPFNLDLNNS